MQASKPRAYAQGDFDNLCGVYAVVNAVRHAATPVRSFRGKDCRWLFGKLISHLADERVLEKAIAEGLSAPGISELLNVSRSLISTRYRINLIWHRPFHGRPKVRLRTLIDEIDDHYAEPGGAVLIGVTWHWTVVRKVGRRGFRLLDSAEIGTLRFDEFKIGPPVRAGWNDYRLLPSWVFLVRAGPTATPVRSR